MYKKHDISRIKELGKQGISQTEIAKLTGASKQIVSYHLKGIVINNGINACMYCNSKVTKLHHRKDYRGKFSYVACSKCHARGPDSLSDKKAIEIWNSVSKLFKNS